MFSHRAHFLLLVAILLLPAFALAQTRYCDLSASPADQFAQCKDEYKFTFDGVEETFEDNPCTDNVCVQCDPYNPYCASSSGNLGVCENPPFEPFAYKDTSRFEHCCTLFRSGSGNCPSDSYGKSCWPACVDGKFSFDDFSNYKKGLLGIYASCKGTMQGWCKGDPDEHMQECNFVCDKPPEDDWRSPPLNQGGFTVAKCVRATGQPPALDAFWAEGSRVVASKAALCGCQDLMCINYKCPETTAGQPSPVFWGSGPGTLIGGPGALPGQGSMPTEYKCSNGCDKPWEPAAGSFNVGGRWCSEEGKGTDCCYWIHRCGDGVMQPERGEQCDDAGKDISWDCVGTFPGNAGVMQCRNCKCVQKRVPGDCFVAGTKVAVAGGEKNIEEIKKGDTVIAVDSNGAPKTAPVLRVFETTGNVTLLKSAASSVFTTARHPFMLPGGQFKTAGELQIGEKIVVFDKGNLREEKIASKEELGEEAVYNLEVGAPNTFIANGFVVHNKGGGVPAFCGDGVVNQFWEQCESSAQCSSGQVCSGCLCVPSSTPRCGDGVVGNPPGYPSGGIDQSWEQCEGSGASAACDALYPGRNATCNNCLCNPAASCGNGVVESPTEECEDMGASISPTCKGIYGDDRKCVDCVCNPFANCGNGIREGNEECDSGAANSDFGACSTACKKTFCGDSIIQASGNGSGQQEQCERSSDCPNFAGGEVCETCACVMLGPSGAAVADATIGETAVAGKNYYPNQKEVAVGSTWTLHSDHDGPDPDLKPSYSYTICPNGENPNNGNPSCHDRGTPEPDDDCCLTYFWSCTRSPTTTSECPVLSSSTDKNPTFTVLGVNIGDQFTFSLVVQDKVGNISNTSFVTVTVSTGISIVLTLVKVPLTHGTRFSTANALVSLFVVSAEPAPAEGSRASLEAANLAPPTSAYIKARIVERLSGKAFGSEYNSELGLDEGARQRPADMSPSPARSPDIANFLSTPQHTFDFKRPDDWDAIDPNSWGTVLDEDTLGIGNYRLIVDVYRADSRTIIGSKSHDFSVVPPIRATAVPDTSPITVVLLVSAVLFTLWKTRESAKAGRGKMESAKPKRGKR